MADMNVVQVAVDAYNGNTVKYSNNEAMKVMQAALVEANNGSTKLDYKAIRDGKCVGLFALIEEILQRTVIDSLQQSDYFMNLVDYRNVAQGDKNIFEVEDYNMFVVSRAAEGTQGIRRQRLSGMSSISIPTHLHVVKIYEELNRVLSGAVDFNHFIKKVADSFSQEILKEIYDLWTNATATDFGGAAFFPAAGAYDEDKMIELVNHVEAAANGAPATIIGTKAALRKLMPSVESTLIGNEVRGDMYNQGYVGKFYGTNVIALPQRHIVNTTDFVFTDKTLTVVAGSDKPIKFVTEGDSLMIMGDPMNKADLSQEYLYGERYGMGIMLAGGNGGIGRYTMT